MRCLAITFVLVCVCTWSSGNCLAVDRPTINTLGEPELNIPISTDIDPLFQKLSLRHMLVYDGARFNSRVWIPEVESYLVRSGSINEFIWKPFRGRERKINLLHDIYHGGRQWIVRGIGGVMKIESGSDAITYKDCRPVEAVIGSYTYGFEYANGRLVNVNVIAEGFSACLKVEYDASGLRTISYGPTAISVIRNEVRQIVCCRVGGEVAAEFSYTNGLLREVRRGGSIQLYTWGSIHYKDYIRCRIPLPPVVVADGFFYYSYLYKDCHLSVGVRSVNNSLKLPGWKYHFEGY